MLPHRQLRWSVPDGEWHWSCQWHGISHQRQCWLRWFFDVSPVLPNSPVEEKLVGLVTPYQFLWDLAPKVGPFHCPLISLCQGSFPLRKNYITFTSGAREKMTQSNVIIETQRIKFNAFVLAENTFPVIPLFIHWDQWNSRFLIVHQKRMCRTQHLFRFSAELERSTFCFFGGYLVALPLATG